MAQKNIVYVPSSVTVLKYNDFYRDFEGDALDFGRISFIKTKERCHNTPLCFVYDNRQEEPFYYTCPVPVTRSYSEVD